MEIPSNKNLLNFFLSLIAISLSTLPVSNSSKLSKNGGYDLVVGIEELTASPPDISKYRANVQNDFMYFSQDLWRATKGKFFINSVDVLVPTSWTTPTDTATFQAYEMSDIKISAEFEAPRVENPNPCGAAGRHIELPVAFFNQSRLTQNYGEASKALLNLFARYRFGVWEEHGEIENSKFPYFYMKPSLTPIWESTGCSSDLQGTLLNESGESSDKCDPWSPTGPTEVCRFVPSRSNTINSSLTYLPWANSVHQFCDEGTHNHNAPNRHNHFCGYRSAWEVIRASEDYWTVTGSPSDSIPPPTFRFLKTSSRPLFYLLLDRGRTATDLNVVKEVKESLQGLFDGKFLSPDTIATIGTYPHVNTGRDHEYVREEAPWAPIQAHSVNFTTVIEKSVGFIDGPVIRDFGEAIKEVTEKIKSRNHLGGAVILVLKRGATQNGFEKLTYAGDVISSLKERNNIRLFAIELKQGEKSPYVNLQSLVQATNGVHHVVNTTTNVKANLLPFLNQLKGSLENGLEQPKETAWNVYKGFVQTDSVVEVPVLDNNLDSLTLCLTTKRHILESDIEIRQLSGGPPASSDKTFQYEWSETADTSRRSVTILKILKPQEGSIWSVGIRKCESDKAEDCLAFLVASVAYTTTSAMSPQAEQSLSRRLNIDVLTSAENNYLDFDLKGAKIVPFSIFGVIELDGQRVLDLETVTATIIYNNMETWTITLKDDGGGLPDVSEDDGIYSGLFVPPKDGLYKIYISASHHRTVNEIPEDGLNADVPNVNSLGRLIPIDQLRFGCTGSTNRRCIPAQLTGSLSKTSDMTGTILVEHTITFAPKPAKIVDFKVTTLPGFVVKFGFTAPRVLGLDGAQVDEYHIYFAPKVDNFVGGTELTIRAAVQVGHPPGTYVEFEYSALEEAIPFYAVEAVYKDQKGGPSNVVGVVTSATGIPPIPIPTTTTTTEATVTKPGTSAEPEVTTGGTVTSSVGTVKTTTVKGPTTTTKLPPNSGNSRFSNQVYHTAFGHVLLTLLFAYTIAY